MLFHVKHVGPPWPRPKASRRFVETPPSRRPGTAQGGEARADGAADGADRRRMWAKGCGTSRHSTRATGQGESRQDPRHQGPLDKGRRDRIRETSGDWRVDEARVDERRYRFGIARPLLHDESCTVGRGTWLD